MQVAAAGPQQELSSLRAARAEYSREKERLTEDIAQWTEKLAQKKDIIEQLGRTVSELQKPDGKRDGLLRCAADFGRPPRAASSISGGAEQAQAQEDSASSRPSGPSTDELDLGCRLAAAVAAGPNADVTLGWAQEDFEREFALGADDAMQRFFHGLSQEQRLVWEFQNPLEYSLKVDRQLLQDLKKAGRAQDAELLTAAAGPPTERERQYRALLLLRNHSNLDVCYIEPTVRNTSLVTLACQAGFPDAVRELLDRRADVHHVNDANHTALLAACHRRSWDCMRLLLSAAADPNEVVNGQNILATTVDLVSEKEERPKMAMPPLCSRAVQLLLEFKAEPNAADPTGQTVLMRAAAKDKNSVCKMLMEARADPCTKDGRGRTAVEVAIEHQHFALAEWLETQMA